MSDREILLRNMNRRLRRRLKRIATLYDELQELEELIEVPTPKEFDEMVRGLRPLTPEALMIGAIALASYHLSEARVVLDRYSPYTPTALARAKHFWRSDIQKYLADAVWFRAEKSTQRDPPA